MEGVWQKRLQSFINYQFCGDGCVNARTAELVGHRGVTTGDRGGWFGSVTTIRASSGRHKGVIKKSTISPSAVLIVISSLMVPILWARGEDWGIKTDSLMIEIRFLIFGPKITPGLIFTQNSYIIIPGRFEWPRGKELVCVSYFLSIQWSAAVRPGPSQWASSLEMIIITWTRRNLMQPLPPPSGHRVIINTSLTRGRLRVSSVVALLTLFPRLCVAMLTPGDTRAPSLSMTRDSTPAIIRPRAPAPPSHRCHYPSNYRIIPALFIQKGEKNICQGGGENHYSNGSRIPRLERLSICQFSKE